jgi:Spy/CpxP family protein refolding chaperone
MKRTAFVLAVLLVVISCSSSDDDQSRTERRPPMSGGYGRGTVRAAAVGGLDLLPPSEWWRDPYLVEPLKLTPDQLASLDKIGSEQSDEIARLERDSDVALRDLRSALSIEKPASDDILAATGRIRGLRDSLFDRQARMLADERIVLTRDQWGLLQTELQEERAPRPNREGGRSMGGRGGRGGRGRGRYPG